jgi:hypothetical protein
MSNETIVKRSPIVLMWKFAVIEAAGFFLYFGATLLGNAKYDLYTQLSVSNFLSYQAAKILFLSGAQFAVTVYAFLAWYGEYYIIRSASITHARGVFFKKEVVFPTNDSTIFTILSGPLRKLFHYGSIRAENGQSSLIVADISRPELLLKIIKQEGGPHENAFAKEPDISRLITENEHDRLEFKSSLRFDHKIGRASRDIEKAAMKTVAAFLNSKGGHLVLGVSDARVPLGLENDYSTLQRKDGDGFENHFTQTFNSMIGPEFRNLVKLWFRQLDGHDLCVVQVLASPRPVYLKADNNEQFYMRTGNISTALKLSEIESYSRTRWARNVNEA